MNEYLEILQNWTQNENQIALARVLKTWGSAPRPAGSVMLVNSDGEMAGSVSGGCVEGAVVKESLKMHESGESKKLSYGVSDEDAWSVGLSCGGSIQVFLQPLNTENNVWNSLLSHIRSNKSAILVTAIIDGEAVNSLITEEGNIIGDEISEGLQAEAQNAYKERQHRTVEIDNQEYFIHLFPRKPQLIIIGVAHITVDLVTLGKMYGFETIVIDPRGYFAEKTTFETQPDQVFQDYPSEVLPSIPLDAYSFCAILSHDPKIDDNALQVLLQKDLGYVGALGSRKTHAKRTARLLEKGMSQEQIDRIHAPIGMPIKAKSAREIALAVMGEIIQAKNQFA